MPGPLPPNQAPATEVPNVAPVTTATPSAANLPPGATSEPAVPIAEKVIGAAVAAIPNAASLTNVDPWLVGWSGALNIALDRLKNVKQFPETWTPVVMVVVALLIGWIIYAILASEAASVALGKGAWIATTAHTNWIGGKRLGVFAPTDPAKRAGS